MFLEQSKLISTTGSKLLLLHKHSTKFPRNFIQIFMKKYLSKRLVKIFVKPAGVWLIILFPLPNGQNCPSTTRQPIRNSKFHPLSPYTNSYKTPLEPPPKILPSSVPRIFVIMTSLVGIDRFSSENSLRIRVTYGDVLTSISDLNLVVWDGHCK